MKNKILLNNKIKYLAAVAVALLCYLSATAQTGSKINNLIFRIQILILWAKLKK
jgi:hypothetical protein